MLPNICARHIVAFLDSFLSHIVAYVTSCVVSSLDVCAHITPRLQSFPNAGHFIYVWTSSALPQHMCDIRLAIEVTFQYISTCISTQLGLHFSGVCSDIWYTYANICDHICVRSYSYEIRSYLREIRFTAGGAFPGAYVRAIHNKCRVILRLYAEYCSHICVEMPMEMRTEMRGQK